MKNIFGVNSAIPANKRLKNGYTMYEWIMRKKCFPAFWGRTLAGKDAMTKEEIDFLRSKNCKIVPMIRNFTEGQISADNGTNDAIYVVQVAKRLGIPPYKGIAIFVEVKPEWSINHNWMITFGRVLSFYGYVPGFIGNTDSSKNFNFDRQCSHYVQFITSTNEARAMYGATEPKRAGVPAKWEPYCPSALQPEDMHLWACGKTVFDKFVVEDVYARDEKVLACMW
ncbi:MAG: hypothetical protein IJ036_04775 [Lachnospiraceae bacterium]|nr:hypothetical protein [Lachnospiraceae bacterium]